MRVEAECQCIFGEYGPQATTSHWITNRQIEAARIAMTSLSMKRWCYYIFPTLNQGQSVKAAAVWDLKVRWVAPVKTK